MHGIIFEVYLLIKKNKNHAKTTKKIIKPGQDGPYY